MTARARVETSTIGGIEIVRLIGEIDLSNSAPVLDAIREALPDGDEVVLDLSQTGYLDSAGIAMLFRLAERLSYNRRELQLVIPPDAPIRAVIELTKMDQVVVVKDSVG